MRRTLVILAAVLGLLLIVGHRSGNQPRLDAVAAARRELGIELDARRVAVGEVELFVVRAGPPDGPPVVLLHGFPGVLVRVEGRRSRRSRRRDSA